jgi:hypothetical protein
MAALALLVSDIETPGEKEYYTIGSHGEDFPKSEESGIRSRKPF